PAVHRARLVRHARQRAEWRQAVLHTVEVVLRHQHGGESLALGHVGQLLERELAGREVGVHVDDRGQPLVRLRGVRRRRAEREGAASASAAASPTATSDVAPVTSRRSRTPSPLAWASSAVRSGPSPTSTTRADGTAAASAGSAATRRSKPLTGTKRPSPATTK